MSFLMPQEFERPAVHVPSDPTDQSPDRFPRNDLAAPSGPTQAY